MDATALSPTPSRDTTLPIPNESCTTRSPGASVGTSRFWPRASASARTAAVPNRRAGEPAVRRGRRGTGVALRQRGQYRAAPGPLCGLGAPPVDEIDRQLVEEPGGGVVRRSAP